MTILAEIVGGDVLSDVLNVLRLRGRLFCQSEMSAPWSVAFPPGAFAHFHVVREGRCWIRLGGQDRVSPLRAGDFVMVPHGRGHQISDAPDRRPVPIAAVLDNPDGGLRAILRHGGGGEETRLLCGSFEFESTDRHPLLSLLPDLIHIPSHGEGNNWLDLTGRLPGV